VLSFVNLPILRGLSEPHFLTIEKPALLQPAKAG